MAWIGSAVAIAILLGGAARVRAADVSSWRPRQHPEEPSQTHQLRDPSTWPAEPPAPAEIDPARFREALAYLCRAEVGDIADAVRSAAGGEGMDPFLLGALVWNRSRCETRKVSRGGLGLLQLHPALYHAPGAPRPPVERAAWSRKGLLSAAGNLALGARLLRWWDEIHASLDERFGGARHRTGLAHFVWGDRVLSSGHEDLVFTARRRLIARYEGKPEIPIETRLGIPLVSPLEGAPRVATSGPGDERDGGARTHRGLDIAASTGEPVRAIGDGVVAFAGVNLPGAPRKGPLTPSRARRYAHRKLGAGGIYVCVRHSGDPISRKGVVSCYMHLSGYLVEVDERVRAGQTIGHVGRSGVSFSPPHLHLELRVDDRFTNPLRYLGSAIIPPKATLTYRYALAAKRAKARAQRRRS